MAMTECPCRTCKRNGCGSYHDVCPRYLTFKRKREDLKKLKDKAYLSRPPHRKGE